jgi:hypothetical protein
MNTNHTQFSSSDLQLIEAEAAVTNHSMKLHSASKEAVRARDSLNGIAESITSHVRKTGLTPPELVDYFVHRAVLTASLGSAKLRLMEAEEAEASAEYEWELAVQHLASLLS